MAYVQLDPRGRLVELNIVPSASATPRRNRRRRRAARQHRIGRPCSRWRGSTSRGSVPPAPSGICRSIAMPGLPGRGRSTIYPMSRSGSRPEPGEGSPSPSGWSRPGPHRVSRKSDRGRRASALYLFFFSACCAARCGNSPRPPEPAAGSGRPERRAPPGGVPLSYLAEGIRSCTTWRTGPKSACSPTGGRALLQRRGWLVYIALEPYVRRLWPEVLISWSRLLSGRIRDPRVGRDVLIGGVAGLLLTLGLSVRLLLPARLGGTPIPPSLPDLAALSGLGPAVGEAPAVSLALPVFILFFILLARVTLRNQWVALGAITVLWTAIELLQKRELRSGSRDLLAPLHRPGSLRADALRPARHGGDCSPVGGYIHGADQRLVVVRGSVAAASRSSVTRWPLSRSGSRWRVGPCSAATCSGRRQGPLPRAMNTESQPAARDVEVDADPQCPAKHGATTKGCRSPERTPST